ncbi:MAG: ATP-dependent DNA helicase RecG [Spirochaetales bacterium]|nr:ATP-dependent DNA helicase RecG [Spirochaetales bacterium]
MYVKEFNQDITLLKGVGPKLSRILKKLTITTIAEVIFHFPRDYIDRSQIDTLKDALNKEKVHVIAKVIAHDYIGWGRKKALKVYIEDNTGQAALVCFGRNYLESVLIPGKQILVSGSFKYKYHEIQSSYFEVEPFPAPEFSTPEFSGTDHSFTTILPVYPLTEGLTQGYMRKIMKNALFFIRDRVEDELPLSIQKKYNFPKKSEALYTVHFPDNMENLEKAKNYLVYEELFYLQLIIGRRTQKRKITRVKRPMIPFAHEKKIIVRLPFPLTDEQEKAIAQIKADLFSSYPMARLLQGDVGCGKTLVAVICLVSVIESGEQVAFLAPTELLARQHAENIASLLEPIGIRIAFLSGNIKGEARKHIISGLTHGSIDLLIGTHALFSEDISFKKLGFVIVDEQHRFGVVQRVSLVKKGNNPDLLLMTATPIPRTLALTAFGDLSVSTIKALPLGRKKIITHLTREGNEQKVYKRIHEEIMAGKQAYFVYPLIEESEKLSLKHAEGMYKKLTSFIFPGIKTGLIHSRLPEDEKIKTMEGFIKNEIQILVSTSVVEVGVDVPNANCMVIEHAERFGLSALHQLRGRVGRGIHQSYAFLIYSHKLTEDGIRRLKVMMETTDGFRISEEDLRIRGPGELLGLKQSGFLKLYIADLAKDIKTMEIAREDTFAILKKDPDLLEPGHHILKEILDKTSLFPEEWLEGHLL